MAHKLFSGAKLAVLLGSDVLTLLRDDKPDIPFPNLWDLAGGGREGNESPIACAQRECFEEFGLRVPKTHIFWARQFNSLSISAPPTWFFVARVPQRWTERVRFGDEGQSWDAMPVARYLAHPRAVPTLCARLAQCLEETADGTARDHDDVQR